MKEIRFGIAGYGKMGKIREATIEKSKNADLISIFDISEEFKDKEHSKKCSSFEELLDSNIDALIVATTVSAAPGYVRRALESGKHVLCEKPPAKNLNEFNKLIEPYTDNKKILKYGFNHRFHYSVMEAKKLISSGIYGKILWMRGVYGKAGSIDFNKNWRNYKKYSGGGILLDQGIHMLDLFMHLSNENFEVVHSVLTKSFWDIECEDNAFVTLKSENGIVATLHSSATQWKHKFLLEIAFENGYINLDGILSSTGSYAPEKLIYGMREFEDITYAMGKPRETTVYFENDDSWKLELDEFINSIRSQKPVKNGTIIDAQKILQLTDNIYKNFNGC